MDTIFIVLGVIIVILLYIIYTVAMYQLVSLAGFVDLKGQNKPITILTQPYSSQYTYNLLLYLNPGNIPANGVIFQRGSLTDKSTDNIIALSLIQEQSEASTQNQIYNIYCNVADSTGSFKSIQTNKYTVMTNAPLNQWLYITLSMNSGNLDIYIDGLLVNSFNTGVLQISTSVTNQVQLGQIPAFIQSFTYYPYAFSATDAYNSYFGLNSGVTAMYKLLTTYTVNVDLIKNGVVMTTQTIL